MKIKIATAIMIFIFWAVVTAILIVGLVFYPNKQDDPSGNTSSINLEIYCLGNLGAIV